MICIPRSYVIFIIFFILISSVYNDKLFSEIDRNQYLSKIANENDKLVELKKLNNVCIDNARNAQQWWTYILCFKKGILQIHIDHASSKLVDLNSMGTYIEAESSADHHIYREDVANCKIDHQGTLKKTHFIKRETTIDFECCEIDQKQLKLNRYSYLPKLSKRAIIDDPTTMASAWLDYEPGLKKSTKDKVDTTSTSDAYISSIEEPSQCSYHIIVCSNLICAPESKSKYKDTVSSKAAPTSSTTQDSEDQSSNTAVMISGSMSAQEQNDLKERSRAAFYHAYDSYMRYAYPQAELKPISCSGGNFDLIKIPLVTLIDSLDTLVILGNYSEFRKVVGIVSSKIPSFDYDVNVSVFETTIRVLGGLLSAHLLAIDPALDIYDPSTQDSSLQAVIPYDGRLLQLAVDLGERLYPAFYTKTGIPYGTVNLRYGVPIGETKIASTAGAGSLLLEFQALSHLSGIHKFGDAAYAATTALYERRSSIGLLGKHINTETGKWYESLSGVGSNADSFYEYLLKAYLLFRNKELYNMFINTYQAIKRFVMVNERWFTEVDMFSGKVMRKRMENLDAFWPGVEAMLGHTKHSSQQLNTFYSVWSDLGFFPEEIDYAQWQQGKGAVNGLYPLRPEIIESTYHHYRTTGDRSWLLAGKMFLESLEQYTRTKCGYATVADIDSMILEDTMPSFFLSETCKYLFLLFDEDNFIHKRPYIFTTEAHPFDVLQIYYGDIREKNLTSESTHTQSSAEDSAVTSLVGTTGTAIAHRDDGNKSGKKKRKAHKITSIAHNNADVVKKQNLLLLELLAKSNFLNIDLSELKSQLLTATSTASKDTSNNNNNNNEYEMEDDMTVLPVHSLHTMKCRKPLYWDASSSYDAEYLQEMNSKLRKQKYKGSKKYTYRNKTPQLSTPLTIDDVMSGDIRRPLRIKRNTDTRKIAYNIQIIVNELDIYKEYRSNETYLNASQSSSHLIDYNLYNDLKQNKWRKLINLYPPIDICLPSEKPVVKTNAKDNKTPGQIQNSPNENKNTIKGTGKSSSEQKANNADPDVLKTVEVSLGELGDFLVKVYADGFVIDNSNDGIRLEISNVGRQLVLIRQSGQSKPSKILVSNWEESSLSTCKVQVTRNHKLASLAPAIVWERPCSIANFGLSSQQISVHTQGELAIPGYGSNQMCKAAKEEFKDIIDELEGKRWWFWSWEYHQNQNPHSYDPNLIRAVQQGRPIFENKIIIADRGDCLFEEKAQNAIAEGASGLIIANSEDVAFIMAGKKEVEAVTLSNIFSSSSTSNNKNKKKLAKKNKNINQKKENPIRSTATDHTKSVPLSQKMLSSNSDDLNQVHPPSTIHDYIESSSSDSVSDIPTVMLSKTDAIELKELLEINSQLTDYKIEYIIDIEVNHMIFNSDLFGNVNYPKIWVQKDLIFVQVESGWGAYLKSKKGDDWQLFVMSSEDIYLSQAELAPPYEVYKGDNRQPITIPHTILTNPVELYSYAMQRKCPNIIKAVEGSDVIVKNTYFL